MIAWGQKELGTVLRSRIFRGLLAAGILVLWAASAWVLHAQSSKIEIDLFGPVAFPLRQVQQYSYNFNAYGYGEGWDSYQEAYFKGHSVRLGFGAGLTYWISDGFGLRIQAASWNKQQVASDNFVSVKYSYIPWYPHIYPPVEVTYDLKSDVQPGFNYRISAFSLNGVLRKKIGPVFVEPFAGLTVYQVGGELQNLYLSRTIPMSHQTFLSQAVVFSSRFDFMSLGGNLGLDLAFPFGGSFEGFLGLQYFFGGSGEPEMSAQSMIPLDTDFLSLVMPGIDLLKDLMRYGPLRISPSSLSLNFGLRYGLPYSVSSPGGKGKFGLMLGLGAFRMNPDISYERTVLVTDDGSYQLSQNIDLFSKKLHISYGGGACYDFSPHWGLELQYQHQPESLDVDSGPVMLIENLVHIHESIFGHQRPQARAGLDEFSLSLVRYFPISGARILVSAGVSLARLSLSLEDLSFWHWNFVSSSGLYTTAGTSWLLGGRAAPGIQFPIASPLEGRLTGSYNFYRKASIPLTVKDFELDPGVSDQSALTPDLLKQSPAELMINPSRLRLAFDLVIRF